MPILVCRAKTSVLNQSFIGMYLACIVVCLGMYSGMSWYVLACIWYVMACIEFQFSTLIFAQHTSIGMYPGMYRYGLSKYWACIQTQYVS